MEREMQRSEIVRGAIELGRPHGFVTLSQLNELLSSGTDITAPEEIEAVMEALSDEGTNIVEDD